MLKISQAVQNASERVGRGPLRRFRDQLSPEAVPAGAMGLGRLGSSLSTSFCLTCLQRRHNPPRSTLPARPPAAARPGSTSLLFKPNQNWREPLLATTDPQASSTEPGIELAPRALPENSLRGTSALGDSRQAPLYVRSRARQHHPSFSVVLTYFSFHLTFLEQNHTVSLEGLKGMTRD